MLDPTGRTVNSLAVLARAGANVDGQPGGYTYEGAWKVYTKYMEGAGSRKDDSRKMHGSFTEDARKMHGRFTKKFTESSRKVPVREESSSAKLARHELCCRVAQTVSEPQSASF